MTINKNKYVDAWYSKTDTANATFEAIKEIIETHCDSKPPYGDMTAYEIAEKICNALENI